MRAESPTTGGPTVRRPVWKLAAIVVAVSAFLTLAVLEAGARLWIALRWPEDRVFLLTHATELRGRFTTASPVAYGLRPDFRDPTGRFTHNAYGFRGTPFATEKPDGTVRIVFMGASTVYGIHVSDPETAAQRLADTLAVLHAGRRIEVLNTGVPGWTSAETLVHLTERVLPLRPDIIVLADGRNDIFPQLFDGYRADYSHFRRRNADLTDSNAGYKRLFRLSHLAMWFVARGDGHFGFDWRAENPAYASIDYANLPSPARIAAHAADTARTRGFRVNLEAIVRTAQAHGARVVLSTIPFRADGYHSGVIPRDSAVIPVLARQAHRNNGIVREVAAARALPLVDAAATLERPELLVDDCHFNADGERAWARLILERVDPLVRTTLTLLAARERPERAS